ncbi:hypothetical protein FAGAP_10109 [Fusarium agapanthi]|uniref:Uncharacterized protein n=1 Tax=Fusarium agapanthi TaxID=1803897 RepID=A0A9P5B3D7_9HYPO|nr:hypothetical protein FAGAP_10109 [Fusarium agapanthi]
MNGFGAKRVAPGWGAPLPLQTGILGENTTSTDQGSGVGEQHKIVEPEATETTVDTNKVSALIEAETLPDEVRQDESDESHVPVDEVETTEQATNVSETVREVLDTFLRQQIQPSLVEISEKQAVVEASFKTVTSLTNGVSKLEQQVSVLGAGLRSLSSDVREHKATEVANLTRALAKSEKDKKSLGAQLDTTKSELVGTRNELASRRAEIDDLLVQLEELQTKVDDLESQQVQSIGSSSSAEAEKVSPTPETRQEDERRRRRRQERDRRSGDGRRRQHGSHSHHRRETPRESGVARFLGL